MRQNHHLRAAPRSGEASLKTKGLNSFPLICSQRPAVGLNKGFGIQSLAPDPIS